MFLALLTDGFGAIGVWGPQSMRDLEQLGSGGPNPCGDSVKKTNTHFLSRINGWIWSNWGLGAQIHVETVLRK